MGNAVGLDVTSNVIRCVVSLEKTKSRRASTQALDSLIKGSERHTFAGEDTVLKFLAIVEQWGPHYRLTYR